MHRFDEIADANLERWYADYLHVKATNGESFEDQYRRVADFLDELRQKPYEQVAIFAHGGILLNAQIYAGIIKPEEAFGALTPYGGIVKIDDEKKTHMRAFDGAWIGDWRSNLFSDGEGRQDLLSRAAGGCAC